MEQWATEGLADSETLARRAAEGRGLTRPELAVLLSSAKLRLQADITWMPGLVPGDALRLHREGMHEDPVRGP